MVSSGASSTSDDSGPTAACARRDLSRTTMNNTSNTTRAIAPATAPAITPIESLVEEDVSDCADAVVAVLLVQGCVVAVNGVTEPGEAVVLVVLDVGLIAVDVLVAVEPLVVGFSVVVSRVEVVEEVVVEVALGIVVAFAECK